MKRIGVILLIYNVILKLCCDSDWYYYAYVYIDAIDTIFYIFAIAVFIKMWLNKFKGIDLLYKHSFVCVFILLGLKIIYNEFNINYQTYSFYFWLLCTTPIILKIERNINYR
jgi:hypothetical protein